MPKSTSSSNVRPQKTFAKYRKPLTKLPNLVENQILSYKDLTEKGIVEIFREFSPLRDYSEKKFDLEFLSFELSSPKYDEVYAKENKLTYEAPLRARVKLTNKILNTVKEQEIFMADFPLMTVHGTFIINGVERVVVPQLARSFGVFFDSEETKGKRYFGAKIIPSRGVWIELGTEADGGIYVRVDKKRKFSAVALLRIFGFTSDEAIKKAFAHHEVAGPLISTIVDRDEIKTLHDAYIEVYKRLRDGDLATPENAKEYIDSIISPERYDLSPVGRFRFNKRFGKSIDQKDKEAQRRTLSKEDLVDIITHIIELNNNPNAVEDDIDHLGSRRVRYVGYNDGVETLLGTVNTNLTTLIGHVDGLETLLGTIDGRVDGLEALIGTTNTNLSTLAGYLDGVETLLLGSDTTAKLPSCAGSTNATNVKSSAGKLYQVSVYNNTASLKYLKIYNKASSPTVGSDTPIFTWPIPANGGFVADFPKGHDFSMAALRRWRPLAMTRSPVQVVRVVGS
jgi:DNA-directed RNA polymerase subunit beta